MGPIVVVMIVVVAVALLALAYAAFPGRGQPVPGVPWLGEALERAADAVPTLEDGDLDPSEPFLGQHRAPSREDEDAHR